MPAFALPMLPVSLGPERLGYSSRRKQGLQHIANADGVSPSAFISCFRVRENRSQRRQAPLYPFGSRPSRIRGIRQKMVVAYSGPKRDATA